MTASKLTFLVSASANTLIATMSDPFAGTNNGNTVYSTFGVVPPQIALIGNSIYTTSTPSSSNTSYTMAVLATSGNGKRVVGDTFNFSATGTVAVPSLFALTLSATALQRGVAGTLNIVGTTTGSTLTGTVPAGMTLNSVGRTISGIPTVSGIISFSLVETLAGSPNSPRTTNFSVNIAAPSITLNALSIDVNAVEVNGNYSIKITGATDTSTLSIQESGPGAGPLPTGMTLNSVERTITGTPTAVGTFNFIVVENHPDASNNNRATAFSIIINAQSAVLPLTPFILADPITINGPIQNTGDLQTNSISHSLKLTVQPNDGFVWRVEMQKSPNGTYYYFNSNGSNWLCWAVKPGGTEFITYVVWDEGKPAAGSEIEFRSNEDFTLTILVNGVPQIKNGGPGERFSRGLADPTGTMCSVRPDYGGGPATRGPIIYGPIKVPLRINDIQLTKNVGTFMLHFDGLYSGSPSGYETKVMLDSTVIQDWTDAIIKSNNVPGKVDIDTPLINSSSVESIGGTLTVATRQKNNTSIVVTKQVDFPAPLKMFMNVSNGGYYGFVHPFVDLFRNSNFRDPRDGIPYEDLINIYQMDRNGILHAFHPDAGRSMQFLVMQDMTEFAWGDYTVKSKLPFTVENCQVLGARTLVAGEYSQRVRLSTAIFNGGIFAVRFANEGVPVPPEGIRASIIKDTESELSPYGIWQPKYIEDIMTMATGLRFMDVAGGNGASPHDGETIPAKKTAATRGIGVGSVNNLWSFETMCDLANRTQCDAYVCVPYDADDSFVTEMVQYFHDNLTNGLKLYIEFSNELWNIMFPQTGRVRFDGYSNNLGGGVVQHNGDITKIKYWRAGDDYLANTCLLDNFWLNRAKVNISAVRTETITHTSSVANNVIHQDSTATVTDFTNQWLTIGKITDNLGNVYKRQSTRYLFTSQDQDFSVELSNVKTANGANLVDANGHATIAKADIFWGYLNNGTYTKFRNEPAPGATLTVTWYPDLFQGVAHPATTSVNPYYVHEQDGGQAAMKQQAVRSKQIFQIATPIYADKPNDLITVMGGQSVNLLGQTARFTYDGVAAWTKRIATAPYIGDGVGGNGAENYAPSNYNATSAYWNGELVNGEKRKDQIFSANTADHEQWKTDLFTYCNMALGPVSRTYAESKNHVKQIAVSQGLSPNAIKLMAYEGNQHLFFENRGWGAKGGGGGIHPNVYKAMNEWFQDPRLGELIRLYYEAIESQVGNEFTWYQMTSGIGNGSVQFGSWIANRFTGDRASVRYMALRNKKLSLEGNADPKPTFVSQPTITPATAGPGSTFTVNTNALNGTVFATEWSLNGVRLPTKNSPIAANIAAGRLTCQVGITGPGGLASMISLPASVVPGQPIIDPSPPNITSLAAIRMFEAEPLAHTLTSNKTVTWSVDGGVDAAHFEVSGNTLRWIGNGVKTFANPQDVGADNIYNVTIRAFDTFNNNSNTQDIAITVKKTGSGVTTGDTGWVNAGNTYPRQVSFTVPDNMAEGDQWNIGFAAANSTPSSWDLLLAQNHLHYAAKRYENNVQGNRGGIDYQLWGNGSLKAGDRVDLRFSAHNVCTLHLNGSANVLPYNPIADRSADRTYIRFWANGGRQFDLVSYGPYTP
jgi:hypothetical protein